MAAGRPITLLDAGVDDRNCWSSVRFAFSAGPFGGQSHHVKAAIPVSGAPHSVGSRPDRPGRPASGRSLLGKVARLARWRRTLTASLLASSLVAGLAQPASAEADSGAAIVPTAAASGGTTRESAADLALDGYGDSSGYHLQVTRDGSGWRQLAELRPAGLDPATWLGFQCLSGDGKYAAVVVLPESSVNLAAARDHGAFAYSVEVASGKIHPIASGVGLKYFSPGCGVGDDAVFTTNPGLGDTSTVLTVADLATGVGEYTELMVRAE